jgi:hypothetical protein
MNRKNLTAAVLAGLAGVAGIAGTAQAVNMNPDGLGQVLVYPYYTANEGNFTLLSVVNTTDNAKAVKVRFLEGFNSREVLDFNLYLSEWDVWVASIEKAEVSNPVEGGFETDTALVIPDSSCTVPYLYETVGGVQPFLKLAYFGDFNDGGPEDEGRAAEGHIEMIEMGTLTGAAADAVRHGDDDMPADCGLLTEWWTSYVGAGGSNGDWYEEAVSNADCVPWPADTDDPDQPVQYKGCQAESYTTTNSGGMFGSASVINVENGTMYSYDAKAIDGFDSTDDGIHYIPGTIYPSLNSGNENTAWVFFGFPQNTAVELDYTAQIRENDQSVDAVSAVFMHATIMNEYFIQEDLGAGTEWVVTFPTKNYYVDPARLEEEFTFWDPAMPRAPFNELYWAGTVDARECEVVGLRTWDREENTTEDPELPGGERPPVVSPSLPGPCDPDKQICDEPVSFQLCNEVNVLRFGANSVFETPSFDVMGKDDDDNDIVIGQDSLLVQIVNPFTEGWARLTFSGEDRRGLVGLPVTGFAAHEYENNFLTGGVKANYGGLFGHKGSVRYVGSSTP